MCTSRCKQVAGSTINFLCVCGAFVMFLVALGEPLCEIPGGGSIYIREASGCDQCTAPCADRCHDGPIVLSCPGIRSRVAHIGGVALSCTLLAGCMLGVLLIAQMFIFLSLESRWALYVTSTLSVAYGLIGFALVVLPVVSWGLMLGVYDSFTCSAGNSLEQVNCQRNGTPVFLSLFAGVAIILGFLCLCCTREALS